MKYKRIIVNYSFFRPTRPVLRIPKTPMTAQADMRPSIVQKAARKPASTASGLVGPPFCSRTCVDTICMMPTQRAWPNCEAVLKTAPARACVLSGNTSEMMMRPTVKRISVLTGLKICAMNALPQYGQLGRAKAMSSGAMAAARDETVTVQRAETLSTTRPVVKLRMTPTTRLGRICRPAVSADKCWTSWKLKKVSLLQQ